MTRDELTPDQINEREVMSVERLEFYEQRPVDDVETVARKLEDLAAHLRSLSPPLLDRGKRAGATGVAAEGGADAADSLGEVLHDLTPSTRASTP